MFTPSAQHKTYVDAPVADMREGIVSLGGIVGSQLEADPAVRDTATFALPGKSSGELSY